MKYALVNGIKTEATSRSRGICPTCGSPVRGYDGRPVQINHWKHISNASCDPWFEHETEWHRNWKQQFPVEWQETVRSKDGIKHIADVFNPSKKVVIEFQNSPISVDELITREAFYEVMIWVVNVKPFKNNISLSSIEPFTDKEISAINERFDSIKKNNSYSGYIFHLETVHIWKRDGNNKLAENVLRKFLNLVNNNNADVFSKIWDLLDPFSTWESLCPTVVEFIEELFAQKDFDEGYRQIRNNIEKHNKLSAQKDLLYLDWMRLHKRWKFAKMPVFLDLGDEKVYRIIPEHESKGGFIVKPYIKTNFIKHYSKN